MLIINPLKMKLPTQTVGPGHFVHDMVVLGTIIVFVYIIFIIHYK